MLHAALHLTPGIVQRQRRSGPDALPHSSVVRRVQVELWD